MLYQLSYGPLSVTAGVESDSGGSDLVLASNDMTPLKERPPLRRRRSRLLNALAIVSIGLWVLAGVLVFRDPGRDHWIWTLLASIVVLLAAAATVVFSRPKPPA